MPILKCEDKIIFRGKTNSHNSRNKIQSELNFDMQKHPISNYILCKYNVVVPIICKVTNTVRCAWPIKYVKDNASLSLQSQEVKQKKELVFQHIAQLIRSSAVVPSSSSLHHPTSKQTVMLKNKLQKEINMFAKTIAALAASNKSYKERYATILI